MAPQQGLWWTARNAWEYRQLEAVVDRLKGQYQRDPERIGESGLSDWDAMCIVEGLPSCPQEKKPGLAGQRRRSSVPGAGAGTAAAPGGGAAVAAAGTPASDPRRERCHRDGRRPHEPPPVRGGGLLARPPPHRDHVRRPAPGARLARAAARPQGAALRVGGLHPDPEHAGLHGAARHRAARERGRPLPRPAGARERLRGRRAARPRLGDPPQPRHGRRRRHRRRDRRPVVRQQRPGRRPAAGRRRVGGLLPPRLHAGRAEAGRAQGEGARHARRALGAGPQPLLRREPGEDRGAPRRGRQEGRGARPHARGARRDELPGRHHRAAAAGDDAAVRTDGHRRGDDAVRGRGAPAGRREGHAEDRRGERGAPARRRRRGARRVRAGGARRAGRAGDRLAAVADAARRLAAAAAVRDTASGRIGTAIHTFEVPGAAGPAPLDADRDARAREGRRPRPAAHRARPHVPPGPGPLLPVPGPRCGDRRDRAPAARGRELGAAPRRPGRPRVRAEPHPAGGGRPARRGSWVSRSRDSSPETTPSASACGTT